MTKVQFFNELEQMLHKVPEQDRQEILYDFKEHFAAGLAEGKREEDIVTELGNPKTIAKELLLDYRIEQAEKEKSAKHIVQAIMATVSLSFFNLIFVFGPVVGMIGLYIGLSAMAATLILSPLAWLVSLLFEPVNVWNQFFVSLVLCGSGILLGIGLYYFGKFLYDVLLKYVKFNLRIIKGEN